MVILKLLTLFWKYIFISLKSNKFFYATGDFNLNVLDYNKNEKITKFLNLTFEYDLVPVINKPTGVTKNTVAAIDHIIVNSLLHRKIHMGIIKLDISDHFPVSLIAETVNDSRGKCTNYRHTGIPGLWTLYSGRCTLDAALWTLDSGHWTLDVGHCCWLL